uniref:lysosomal enzyme trafficking factor n=1 Tax=Myxine glutinosa TaxID=7769 RepID=UPI00358FA717
MAWRSMNFRQRMGWICLASYLLASLALAHYIFDVSVAYSSLTLAHGSITTPALSSLPRRLLSWTLALPLGLWIFVVITVYLQVFCFLVSCTRTNPKTMGYFFLPLCLIMMCRSRHPAIKEYRPGIGMSL